jgi:hypothetical protein
VNKQTIHPEKEKNISYEFCSENLKECIKRNQFYNQIRKNLLKKKYERFFKSEIEKNKIENI